jgi:Toprim-like
MKPDGSGKAGTDSDKFMVGSPSFPIVLTPPNDGLGLIITEGIEDALSGQEATAAGAASRLPALADKIPAYIESVTIMVDADAAGRRHSGELAALLKHRAEVRLITLPATVTKVAA